MEKHMKKLKITIWVVLLGFVVIMVFQNQDFFLGKQSLRINLLVTNYRTPEIYNLVLSFVCFIGGLLLGSYFILLDRLKFNKKIKMLKTKNDSHLAEITALQKELDSLRGGTPEPDSKTVVINSESQEPVDIQNQQQ
jgi:hypothetical protein